MVIIMMSIFLSSMVVNVSRGSDEKRNVPRLIHMVCKKTVHSNNTSLQYVNVHIATKLLLVSDSHIEIIGG